MTITTTTNREKKIETWRFLGEKWEIQWTKVKVTYLDFFVIYEYDGN